MFLGNIGGGGGNKGEGKFGLNSKVGIHKCNVHEHMQQSGIKNNLIH